MGLLYFLESIRMPGLNELMLLITRLGEETTFLAIALIVFWCVDKRAGYYVITVGFFGTIANQFLKILCRVPRPWVLDENFTILEAAREAATGYSFPSGHSQNAVGTFGCAAVFAERKWIRRLCIAIAVLVPFSRMYIGVHTPWDVLVGAGMALVLVFALKKPVLQGRERTMWWVIGLLMVLAIGFFAYMEGAHFPADMDAHNLESAKKNAYTMLGCIAAMPVIYTVEGKYIRFSTKAVWWAQLLKAILGLALVLLVKEGLKSPLEALFAGQLAARAVRYFLIVVTAGCLWPLSFRWFEKLGEKV